MLLLSVCFSSGCASTDTSDPDELVYWHFDDKAAFLPPEEPIPRLRKVVVVPTRPILATGIAVPRNTVPPTGPYKSWSLFLVCDPRWLVEAKRQDLSALHDLYMRFG